MSAYLRSGKGPKMIRHESRMATQVMIILLYLLSLVVLMANVSFALSLPR